MDKECREKGKSMIKVTSTDQWREEVGKRRMNKWMNGEEDEEEEEKEEKEEEEEEGKKINDGTLFSLKIHLPISFSPFISHLSLCSLSLVESIHSLGCSVKISWNFCSPLYVCEFFNGLFLFLLHFSAHRNKLLKSYYREEEAREKKNLKELLLFFRFVFVLIWLFSFFLGYNYL